MADYQSLLSRAVANLPNASVAAARQAIYDRARTALVTQLRSLQPPLPDGDIEREERALDDAIEQVELQFAPGGSAREASTETKFAPPHPSPPSRARVAAPEPKPAAAPAVSQRPATPAPGVVPNRTSAAKLSSAPTVASVAQIPPRPVTRPPAPAQPPPGPPPLRPAGFAAAKPAPGAPGAAKPPPVQAAARYGERANDAPPIIMTKTGDDNAVPANLAAVVPNPHADRSETAAAPPVTAGLADDVGPRNVAPVAPVEAERVGGEAQRPAAPTAVAEQRRSWPWLALAVVLGVVLSIAGAAILMRQRPQDLAIAPPPPEPQQEAAQGPPKIAQRAEPSPAGGSAAGEASPAPAAEQQTGQGPSNGEAAPPEQQSPAQLPKAARAAMLIASPDNPQKPVVNLGSTVWSTIPAAPGQPANVAVKAEADIPDLKMHAIMTLRKNTDPTLEATHTIDLKFSFADGAPITGFKDVGLPQMRKLDSTAAETLNSVKVKISDDYFLIALAKGDQDVARNVDLMRTHAWFDFPLLLNDERIAKLVFQKSAEGDAMLEKAFDAWK